MTTEREAVRTRFLSSIRARLLASFVLLLALASLLSVLVVRQVLLNRLDERIDRDLVQETKELRALAGGNDPNTGEPFRGRVRKIFRTYLERNIPSRNESFLTFVDGGAFLRSRRAAPYRLDRDAELVERWSSLTSPERKTVESPAGAVDYLAVPLKSEGRASGVFVVAIFRDLERRETETAIVGAASIGAVVVLIGSLLAWRLASRILNPVRRVAQTARSISDTDLTRRIDVGGRDEISELAGTFNEMLDRLEAAFDSRKQFIDDAGHELRTPITIVRGHLEVLEIAPEEREKTLALVMDELDRMSRLVEELLLLARSEAPEFLDLTVIDIETLVHDMHAKAEAIASRRWKLDETTRGLVVADRQRITQGIIQLAQNASQHTVQGDEIGIGSRVEGREARFWVRDSGPGIPMADQQRIFDRFNRGSAGRRQSGGRGLGLSIVAAIARAHHGRVELKSRLGEGARFEIVIPIDQPPEGVSE